MCSGGQSPLAPPVEYKFLEGNETTEVAVHSPLASVEANNFMSMLGTKTLWSMPRNGNRKAFKEMYHIALMACLTRYVANGVIVTRSGFGVHLNISRLLEVWHDQ